MQTETAPAAIEPGCGVYRHDRHDDRVIVWKVPSTLYDDVREGVRIESMLYPDRY